MRMRIRRKARAAVAMAGLVAALVLAPGAALAHKGHAGPMIDFMKTSDALKAMLPEGAKITRRKEPLPAAGAAWAKSALGVELKDGVYVFYLARDPKSGAALGGAMVREADYEHADVNLAVGVDASGKVTRAAVLGTNQMYVPEFETGVGKGFLKDLEGTTPKDLAEKRAQTPEDNEARRFVLDQLRDMAALLATFLHGIQA
jgi:hypothetical protein